MIALLFFPRGHSAFRLLFVEAGNDVRCCMPARGRKAGSEGVVDQNGLWIWGRYGRSLRLTFAHGAYVLVVGFVEST